MIHGDDFEDYERRLEEIRRIFPKTATEVAEERLEEVANDKQVKDLNKGVLDW